MSIGLGNETGRARMRHDNERETCPRDHVPIARGGDDGGAARPGPRRHQDRNIGARPGLHLYEAQDRDDESRIGQDDKAGAAGATAPPGRIDLM